MNQPEPNLSASPQTDASDVTLTDTPEGRELALNKNGQRFVFRCPPGEEADLLRQLAELADDPGHPLAWFDAARMAHRLGRQFARALEPPGPTSPFD